MPRHNYIDKKHARRVRAALKLKGLLVWEVAAALDPPLKRSSVSCVINGERKTEAIRDKICELTGYSYEYLWGRRYAA